MSSPPYCASPHARTHARTRTSGEDKTADVRLRDVWAMKICRTHYTTAAGVRRGIIAVWDPSKKSGFLLVRTTNRTGIGRRLRAPKIPADVRALLEQYGVIPSSSSCVPGRCRSTFSGKALSVRTRKPSWKTRESGDGQARFFFTGNYFRRPPDLMKGLTKSLLIGFWFFIELLLVERYDSFFLIFFIIISNNETNNEHVNSFVNKCRFWL